MNTTHKNDQQLTTAIEKHLPAILEAHEKFESSVLKLLVDAGVSCDASPYGLDCVRALASRGNLDASSIFFSCRKVEIASELKKHERVGQDLAREAADIEKLLAT